MTNTVMFDLQSAVMAAASAGQAMMPDGTEIPADGVSFSEILASQSGAAAENVTEANGSAAVTAGAADTADSAAGGADIPEKTNELIAEGLFEEAVKLIENSDEGIRKALKLLLDTVIKAITGSDDGKERKTDMFMLFSDGSSDIFGTDSVKNNDLFIGAELMGNISFMLETESISDPQKAIDKLDVILASLVKPKDEKETDENTAADILAAMLSIRNDAVEDFMLAPPEVKTEAVKSAAEALKMPVEALEAEMPEIIPQAEKLYSEFRAVIAEKTAVADAPVEVGFTALKINNASEQVDSIGVRTAVITAAEPERTELAAEPVNPVTTDSGNEDDTAAAAESIAANVQAAPLRTENEVVIKETVPDRETALSVENQITERISEKLSDIKNDNGSDELVIILRPRELGQVAVKLVKENSAVSVMISAQYSEVGKLITERASQLGNNLSDRNYEVRDVRVVDPGNAAEQMGLNFTDRGFSFERNASERQSGGNGASDKTEVIDAIEETEETVLREAKLWTTA